MSQIGNHVTVFEVDGLNPSFPIYVGDEPVNAPPFFKIAVGSNVEFGFQLRLKGQRDYMDLSVAESILLEWQAVDPGSTPQAPLTCNLMDSLNDLDNGLCYFTGTPSDIFEFVSTLQCSLVINIGSQVIAQNIGVIEVTERPGYPEP